MKTYILTVSKVFPSYHPRKGQDTHFLEKLCTEEKKHTIRANYERWKKRIEDVNNGTARLSVRQWSGKPYNSKQEEIFEFLGDSVGIQRLGCDEGWYLSGYETGIPIEELAFNDGLTLEDFIDWFKKYPSEPMAIIHFTDFRY